ncbi:MAG: amino acid ABC transporter permease, partial [Angustibacter sp.]
MSGAVELYEEPGPDARARHRLLTGVSLLLAVLGALWIIKRLNDQEQLTEEKWAPFRTAEIWTEYLIPGLLGTLGAAVVAIVIAMTVGILLGVGRLSRIAPIRILCSAWVEFFRSIPVLMLMLFAYGGLIATKAVQSDYYALTAVIIGLVLYNSAVVAELVRSGVSSLPRGQREAGRAVGLTEGQLMFTILLPQALTAMLPSLISQLVVVLKDTALGYVIGYEE